MATYNSLSKSDVFVVKAALIVGMGGFVYGYDFGVVAGTLSRLKEEFDLDSHQMGLVVSSLPLGCIVACFFGGSLCDKLGRWWTIIAQNIVYATGSLVMYSATSIMHIYIGRFFVGVGIAFSCIANVPYLIEVSPCHARGKVSSAFEFLAAVGLLVSYCINLLVYHIDADWRLLFIIPGAVSLLQAACMNMLPESPNWLLENNMEQKCREALTYVCDCDSSISEKIHEIKKSMASASSAPDSGGTFMQTIIQYRWIVAMILPAILRSFCAEVLRA
jgi:MFS family permease